MDPFGSDEQQIEARFGGQKDGEYPNKPPSPNLEAASGVTISRTQAPSRSSKVATPREAYTARYHKDDSPSKSRHRDHPPSSGAVSSIKKNRTPYEVSKKTSMAEAPPVGSYGRLSSRNEDTVATVK